MPGMSMPDATAQFGGMPVPPQQDYAQQLAAYQQQLVAYQHQLAALPPEVRSLGAWIWLAQGREWPAVGSEGGRDMCAATHDMHRSMVCIGA